MRAGRAGSGHPAAQHLICGALLRRELPTRQRAGPGAARLKTAPIGVVCCGRPETATRGDALVDEWVDVMALEHGWLVIRHQEEFLLLKAEPTKMWTKISSKRCEDLLKRLRAGDRSAIEDAEREIAPMSSAEESEDED